MNLKYKKLIGGNNLYQDTIYEIAKYLKLEPLHKFKQDYGIKQLSNQVIELNKIIYLNELQHNITNYYITDKIDGKRTILYLSDKSSYAISNIITHLNIKTKNICILDTEFFNDKYYIFDILVYEGNILINSPFEERMKYFDKFDNDKFKNIFETKPFIKLNNTFKKQIQLFKNEHKPYEVDGIILTPANGLYNSMKVYKYKPIITVDFLIKKFPGNQNTTNTTNTTESKTLYILFCGIAKRVFFKLRMELIQNYNEIFPHINTKQLPQYFPIQFEPSNKKIAYLYSGIDGLDGEIGEFVYNIETDEWILKKIREDRKIEVSRGNYFGNNYKIAELSWMSYFNPLIIEDISDDNILNNNIYFQEHDNILQKASRNFNSFVKSKLFERIKNIDWVMDLASGKGQDLFRYSSFNIKNVIFLEIDKLALEELINRKHVFSTDHKYKNNTHILIQNVDLLDDYKKNIDLINNIYIKRQNIDAIVCNFAFHYFVSNENTLKNICKLVGHYLKQGGKFIFTAFDGQKILNLLKNNNNWIINNNDGNIKYGIKKKYNTENLLPTGQKIDVLLPFSNNTFYEEYLININTIEEEFKKHNIILEINKSFSSYVDIWNKTLDPDDKTYIDLYHYYVFIKK